MAQLQNLTPGFTSTVTSGTAITMTIASTAIQVLTGTTAQTVKLPTTGIGAGAQYTIINTSTATATVQSSAANTIGLLAGGTSGVFTAVVATPTTAANWTPLYNNFNTNVVAPLINVTATTIPITTVTNVDSRGGISFPANVRVGMKVRIIVDATNAATAQTLTATLRFGTANTASDGAVLTQILAAGTTAVGSGKFIYEFTVLTATTAQATAQFFNGNASTGISATLSAFVGTPSPTFT